MLKGEQGIFKRVAESMESVEITENFNCAGYIYSGYDQTMEYGLLQTSAR